MSVIVDFITAFLESLISIGLGEGEGEGEGQLVIINCHQMLSPQTYHVVKINRSVSFPEVFG